MFATVVLLADALVGERGLVATTRARRQSDELTATRRAAARARTRGCATPPSGCGPIPPTIESLARETLGLIRPGEVLVVVKDVDARDEVIARGCAILRGSVTIGFP